MKSIVASIFLISGILSWIAWARSFDVGDASMFILGALGGICGVVAGCVVLTERQ